MRSFYRTLTVVSTLAGVGSFLVGVYAILPEKTDAPPLQATSPPPQATAPPPAPPPRSGGDCNTEIYKPYARRLREIPPQAGEAQQLSPRKLGADTHHDYYYDYATKDVICIRRDRPAPSALSSDGAKPPDPWFAQRTIAIACVIVIGLCLAGLWLTWRLRRKAESGGNRSLRRDAVFGRGGRRPSGEPAPSPAGREPCIQRGSTAQ